MALAVVVVDACEIDVSGGVDVEVVRGTDELVEVDVDCGTATGIVVVGNARRIGAVVGTARRTVVVDVGTLRCPIVVVVAGIVVDTGGRDVVVGGCRPNINVEKNSANSICFAFTPPGRQSQHTPRLPVRARESSGRQTRAD
jgi:hypothetical protein